MIKTASGGAVVVSTDNKILVVSQHGTSWSLPKGHIDPGEDAKQAAEREIEEESGITDLEFVKLLGTYKRHRIGIDGGEDKSELKTITIFLYTTSQIELEPQDKANPEARWVKLDKVSELLTHSSDKAFFDQITPKVKRFIESRAN